MATITDKILKIRVAKPTIGKWCSDYSACKKYADDNGIPLIGVWSNGEKCGHCTMFETAVMNSAFTSWMASSGCVFWLGCSAGKAKDDPIGSTGYKWAWKNQTLKLYPFVRVWWKVGKIDKAASGADWTGSSSKGYTTFIKKLDALLKSFKPGSNDEAAVEESTTNGCKDGDCSNDTSDCGDCNFECQKKLDETIVALKSLLDEVDVLVDSVNNLKAKAQEAMCTAAGSCKV